MPASSAFRWPLILMSWFFKYAYILFDHTVNGFDEPPTLDIQMLNPLDEQRPLAQVAILGLIYLAVHFAYRRRSGSAVAIRHRHIARCCCCPPLWPSSGWKEHPQSSIPRGLGAHGVAVGSDVRASSSRSSAATHYLSCCWDDGNCGYRCELRYSCFAFCLDIQRLGGALYERRDELELETMVLARTDRGTPAPAGTARQRERGVDAYGQMRAGSHTRAWELLQIWLASHGNDAARLLLAVRPGRHLGRPALPDPRSPRTTSSGCWSLKRNGDALDVVARSPRRRPSPFARNPPPPRLQIAHIAVAGGGADRGWRALCSPTLRQRFAGDPGIPAAAALARHLGIDVTNIAAGLRSRAWAWCIIAAQ